MDAKEALIILRSHPVWCTAYPAQKCDEATELAISALEKVETLEAENARLEKYNDTLIADNNLLRNELDTKGLLAQVVERPKENNFSFSGAIEIYKERTRQINNEGFDCGHDIQWTHNELIRAATCYLKLGRGRYYPAVMEIHGKKVPVEWPLNWDVQWWKPGVRRRDLVKAGALIAAEIDRLDRQAIKNDKE